MSLLAAATKFPGFTVAARAAGALTATNAANATTKAQVTTNLADLKTNLAGLQKNIKNIASITVSDTGSLSFSASELKTYGNVIGKITGKRDLTATAVDMASFQAVAKNKNVKTIFVSDSTANIQRNMGLLVANNAKIAATATGIQRADTATDLTLTDSVYNQANVSGGVLSKLNTASPLTGKINITGVAASQVSARVADTKVKTVSIADSSSNIVAAASNLTTNIAKVTTVNVTSVKATTMDAVNYGTFKTSNASLLTKIASSNPNALDNAFNVTGVSVALSKTTDPLSLDNNVKSIAVSDTTGAVPAALTMSSKVNRVALEMTAAQFNTNLTSIVGLGSKLNSVKITDQDNVTMAVSKVFDKATASALTKTTGNTDSPLNVKVTGAKLSDIAGLIANKQVTDAAISDNVANLLAFSSDDFAALPTSGNIKITLSDTATNLGVNAAALVTAIGNFGQQKHNINLQVNDTAANLGANIDNLETLANTIAGAAIPDLTRIDINQIGSNGLADTTSLVKVSFAQYTSASNMLAYIKADTGLTQGVEIDAGTGNAGINNAKAIGFQLQVAASVIGLGTPALPTSAAGAGTTAPTPNVNKLGLYADVAKVNITFSTAADYATFSTAGDTDIAGYTLGINILA
jgi:hypothetical protein